MLKRVKKRSPEKNLTFHQLAMWWDMEEGHLGKTRWERLKIWWTIKRNIWYATWVCLLVSRRVKVKVESAQRMDVLAEDFWVDDLINRHKTRSEKVSFFMCNQDILDIPIVVSEQDDGLYVEDGNHRHMARKKRGFRKIRGIRI